MNLERKLVTIRTINDIKPIQNADNIELAFVDGWRSVVKKGEFSVGDKCLYFEIDSFLPASDERYAFLNKDIIDWDGKQGIRIKTMKLRGCLSQGLTLALSKFPEVSDTDEDIASTLGVLKWSTETFSQHGRMSNFPSTVSRTSLERVQNLTDIIEKYADTHFQVTDKMDGASITILYDGTDVKVCTGHTTLEDTDNIYTNTVLKYHYDEILRRSDRPIAIQGELMNPTSKNPAAGHSIYLYNIYDPTNHESYPVSAIDVFLNDCKLYRQSLLEYTGGTCMIPEHKRVHVIIDDIRLGDLASTVQDLVLHADAWNDATSRQYAKGLALPCKTSAYKQCHINQPEIISIPAYKKGAEGIVFKSLDGKVAFKAISNEYLYKNK